LPSTPFQVPGFGTLNLRDDPATVGIAQATDLLNVSLSVPGRIATRGGYIKHNTSTPASVYQKVVETRAGGTAHLVGFRGTNLDKIVANGTVSAAAATFPANFQGFSSVDFGSPSGTLLYIADSGLVSGGGTLQKWDGSAIAASSGKPGLVAVTPWDNRLAQGYYGAAGNTPSGANGSKSTVFFSDAGAPDTYTSTSWIQLQPGDGEVITAMVTWREFLFVFKESAVYVFYGTSTASDGTPVFQYRRVSLPSRVGTFAVGVPAVSTACAGPDGVYYHAADGIYRLTGGTPEMISGVVRGLFSGTAASSQVRNGNTGSAYTFYLTCVEEKVYFSYMNGDGNPRVLVYDRPSATWALWSLTALTAPMPVYGTSLYSNSGARFPLFADDATADIYVFTTTATTDNGTAIPWSYKSGFSHLGYPGQAKIASEFAMWGTGSATLKVASDFGSLDAGSSVTLGTSPAITRGYQQTDREGTYLQHEISGTGVAMVNSLVYFMSLIKTAGLE
jgi:hypothetical protein